MWTHTDYTISRVTQPREETSMNPITGEEFIKGNTAVFKYHNKLRVGKVEKVGKTYVTLELDEKDIDPKDLAKFKNFSFHKIQAV